MSFRVGDLVQFISGEVIEDIREELDGRVSFNGKSCWTKWNAVGVVEKVKKYLSIGDIYWVRVLWNNNQKVTKRYFVGATDENLEEVNRDDWEDLLEL